MAFMHQGMFQTYSTRRWSQKGTRTSRPDHMLMRSLRSSRVDMNQLRLSQATSRRRAFSGSSPSSRGVWATDWV